MIQVRFVASYKIWNTKLYKNILKHAMLKISIFFYKVFKTNFTDIN